MSTLTVSSGQTSSFLTVSANNSLTVLAGGQVNSTTVLNGGTENLSGGLDSFGTVSSGGQLIVRSGGLATGTTLYGSALVLTGGTASGTVDRGRLSISAASGVDATVSGVETVSGSFVILPVSGVFQPVLVSSAIISNTTVTGGNVFVYSGGVATGTVLSTTAGRISEESILSGGLAVGTTVMSTTAQIVNNGGSATGTVVSNGGSQTLSRGTALDTNILSGGTVYDGGVLAFDEAGGGTRTVSGAISGAGTIQQLGSGTLVLSSNVAGFTGTVEITAGTFELTQPGGAGTGPILFDPLGSGTLLIDGQTGPANVISGFVAGDGIDLGGLTYAGNATPTVTGNAVSVTEGGVTEVLTIANASGAGFTLASDGASGTLITDTAARPVIVSSGTTLTVSSGQTSSGLVVLNGGTVNVLSGGTVLQTAFNSGSFENLSGGTDSGSTIAGKQAVSAGGSALAAMVTPTGSQTVSSGGLASGAGIAGYLSVGSSGTASGAVLSAFSSDSGGRLVSATVLSGVGLSVTGNTTFVFSPTFSQIVVGSGVASATTVSGGGSVTVFIGGITSGTVLQNAVVGASFGQAEETVSSAASAVSTTIGVGDYEVIYGGGTATGTLVSSGATELASGGFVLNDTVLAGGTLTDIGSGVAAYTEQAGTSRTFAGKLTSNGALVQSGPGTLKLTGDFTSYTGAAIISGGTLELTSGGIATGGTLSFASGTFDTLKIDAVTGPANTISGLALGDVIDLAGLAFSAGGTTAATGNSLAVTEGTVTETIVIAGATLDRFKLTSDGTGGTDVAIACFAAGTMILTEAGERAVEALRIGDRVVTVSGMDEPIRWIGRRSYAGRFLRRQPGLLPVRIRRGALGDGLPRRDLLVSPCHAMLIDGVLVPAGQLVNGTSIVQDGAVERVDYYHVELAQHRAIWAEGAATETFLDDDSRGVFHNAAEFAELYPDAPEAGPFCAPRVDSGYQLEAVRERLATLAGQRTRAA